MKGRQGEVTRISEKQARELLGDKYPSPPKKHKYNARKTVIDGITFDSKREAEFYGELKLRQAAGEIRGFELQPEFVLLEGFRHQGKAVRGIRYRADFRVYHIDGRIEVVDVKGHQTKEYTLKKKLLLARHPDIWFTEA